MPNITPMEQLHAFVDWERKHNPDKTHIAEWALKEIERLRPYAAFGHGKPEPKGGRAIPRK